MSEAVLDAGPLIHLAELEALDTLIDFSAAICPYGSPKRGGMPFMIAIGINRMVLNCNVQ
jgi:hypothetical protein